ncbi:MAG: hypothetical protein WB952_23835 [Terriglobales bacterium]
MKLGWTILAACSALLALLIWSWAAHTRTEASSDQLLLLVPDGANLSDPKVTVWFDAASEEGLHVVPIHDSELVRPFFGLPHCAGLIFPDSIHQKASDFLIAGIRRFVASGGKLMLVYDAGTLSPQGRYAPGGSRLSDLAGVDYAFYDKLQDKAIQWDSIRTSSEVVRGMNIPPGKYYPFQNESSAASGNPGPSVLPDGGFEVQLKRYLYGVLRYPSFVTSGNYSGHVLFHSGAGIAAGEHAYEKGSVLFVNLPLGYLKANTDGLLLHAFLKYFAEHSLALPYLMSVPDGIGGMVLNWHVDSNAAIKPVQEMNSWPIMRQGPYSIHITAGPDAMRFGDGEGFDVLHNRLSQEFVREHVARGDQIGSHGGWIHDYFAAHADQDNPKDLERFLALNKSALEEISGKPVVEYSAPHGNQPKWVTTWLESHGFVAYYFTGNTGMAPTQGYRDGVREGQNIWSFPILHLNQAAAFEEMAQEGYTNSEIEHWLEAISQFTADHQSIRLVYFHPPGVIPYHQVVDQWMEQTARLQAEGRFRWYTMTELGRFLNSRKQVTWKTSDDDGQVTISATHPQSLAHATWRIPSSRFSEPVVIRGSAHVVRGSDAWLVVAGEGKELQFKTQLVSQR